MSAQALRFPEWLSLPLEQGCLSPEQAWHLTWELEQLQDQPWRPAVWETNQLVALFHWQHQGLPQ